MRFLLLCATILLLSTVINSSTVTSFDISSALSYKDKRLFKSDILKVGSGCDTSGFHSLFKDTPDKFTIKEYKAQTQDGYILQMFRVNLSESGRKNLKEGDQKNTGVPVLIVHGLSDSSDSWFFDEDNSIGFYLANKGYDVWLGNNRGNKYSHEHTNANISPSEFFDFSSDELGLYDVPAFYKKVLGETNQDQLIYIGHSQGTTQLFVAGLDDSTRLYIETHTLKFFALAPVVYLKHCGSNVIKFASQFNKIIQAAVGLVTPEVAPASCDKSDFDAFIPLAQFMCTHFSFFCDNLIPGLNFDEEVDNVFDNMEKVSRHFPSGTSQKCVAKYAQMMTFWKDKVFQKFDYGLIKNLIKYGSVNPPAFDVASWNIDTILVGGTKDEFATVEDVTNLRSVVNINKVELYWMDGWDHLTFGFAKNMKPLYDVFDKELP